MNIICLETQAFYALVDEVMKRAIPKETPKKWINTDEAMLLLNIKSKTTLQKLRDDGSLRFSSPLNKKLILYDRESVLEFIEKNAVEPF